MFYDYSKPVKRVAFLLILILTYVLSTAMIGLSALIEGGGNISVFLSLLPSWWYFKLALGLVFGYLLVYLIDNSLDIKASSVGNGQHGKAKWGTDEDKKREYQIVPFGEEREPGFVIEVNKEKKYWLVDFSDKNVLMLAPPGGGKTTCVIVPTIRYNCQVIKHTGKGISMIVTDNKGDLCRDTQGDAESCGIVTKVLDFRFPLTALFYNLMYNVNQHMNDYNNSTSKKRKLKAYAKAETYAKILAENIVKNLDSNNRSDSSEYFNSTARGLITALILLVSEYGDPDQQHLISVFKLIIELNGFVGGSDFQEGLQKNKMEELLKTVDNHRLINYSGAAIKADIRTTMNVFSSALEKLSSFIDAELEQMICRHSPGLDAKSFVEQPTIIYLVCPDENTTRHFFASLFIRTFSNELIELAARDYSGQLPVTVLNLWDEFGNMPAVKDADVLFSAARSRGIRFVISLQSLHQLEKHYSKVSAQILRDTCQIVLFSHTAAGSLSTPKELSEILGKETVLSGSVSSGKGWSSTRQMVGKPLMSIDEIATIPFGQWVVMKSGSNPIQVTLPRYQEYLSAPEILPPRIENEICEIVYLDARQVALNAIRLKLKEHPVVFEPQDDWFDAA